MCARKVRRKKKRKKIGCLLLLLLLFIPVIVITFSNVTDPSIETFAKLHGLSEDEWPRELIEMLEKNPEAKDYVLNYPLKKDMDYEVDLSELSYSENVPLLLQWDERWGYNMYAGELMGLSGCGPTCLSMVAIHLLDDTSLSPEYIANFSEENGYYASKKGSTWTLISEGGEKLGLDVTEIAYSEEFIKISLQSGSPIICIMGPGHFTSSGHFIVITEYDDGHVRVNDPNSISRSEKWWKLSDIEDEILNLWLCEA